jgi:dTDP-4-dehydrorhamnose reductase
VAFDREQCDLSRLERLPGLIHKVKPDVIVNAAAYTAVNEAEDELARAMKVNGVAAGALAQEARKADALLVHYSSDYVFDGSKDGPYGEDDQPCPLNIYGHSKLAGEKAIRQVGGAWLILRTGWVYSEARGRNILRTTLRVLRERQELRLVASQIGIPVSRCEQVHLDWITAQLRERDELRIVADQIGAPTRATEIAETTAAIIAAAGRERLEGRFAPGLFHLTTAGATSWHGFAAQILDSARECGLLPAGRAPRLVAVTTEEYPRPAARPKNSQLAGELLRKRFGLALPPWQECLSRCLAEIRAAEAA